MTHHIMHQWVTQLLMLKSHATTLQYILLNLVPKMMLSSVLVDWGWENSTSSWTCSNPIPINKTVIVKTVTTYTQTSVNAPVVQLLTICRKSRDVASFKSQLSLSRMQRSIRSTSATEHPHSLLRINVSVFGMSCTRQPHTLHCIIFTQTVPHKTTLHAKQQPKPIRLTNM